jgi:hypothetical protein
MADADKEEFAPLLPVGFHELDLAGLRRLCVGRFPHSLTRSRIMDGLEHVLSLLQRNGMRGELWVDGSFTTEKLNPDDADIILVVDAADYRAFSPEQRAFFNGFCNISLKDRFRCDNYGMVRDEASPMNEWLLAYWLRQFGFSRADQMKGLAVIKLPFLVRP